MKIISFILLFYSYVMSQDYFHHCEHPEAHIVECKIMQLIIPYTWYACQVEHEDSTFEVGQLRIFNDVVEFIVFGSKENDEVYVRSGSLIFEDFKTTFTNSTTLYTVTNKSMVGRFVLNSQSNLLVDFEIVLDKHKVIFTPLNKNGNLFKTKNIPKVSFGIVIQK